MRLLIGIDDTDNKETRGTGYRVRCLVELMNAMGVAEVHGVTRHQLFVSPLIPYTSHNSSACIDLDTNNIEHVTQFCREFLLREAAEGSDVGLCVAKYDSVNDEIVNWGKLAKHTVLKMKNAYEKAEEHGLFLEGLTGTKDGIIGAMAAVGLRKYGNDGRMIWLNGKELRELSGIYSIAELKEISHIEHVENIESKPIDENEIIDIGDWVRPIIKNHKVTLIVEEVNNHENIKWKCVAKDYIKGISN